MKTYVIYVPETYGTKSKMYMIKASTDMKAVEKVLGIDPMPRGTELEDVIDTDLEIHNNKLFYTIFCVDTNTVIFP